MTTKKMMQGDSYPVPFTITLNSTTSVTPDMISELEVCAGSEDDIAIRKTFASGEVWYDETAEMWFFRPSQQETLDMEPGDYEVIARLKFGTGENACVIGVKIGRISISDTHSEEVI